MTSWRSTRRARGTHLRRPLPRRSGQPDRCQRSRTRTRSRRIVLAGRPCSLRHLGPALHGSRSAHRQRPSPPLPSMRTDEPRKEAEPWRAPRYHPMHGVHPNLGRVRRFPARGRCLSQSRNRRNLPLLCDPLATRRRRRLRTCGEPLRTRTLRHRRSRVPECHLARCFRVRSRPILRQRRTCCTVDRAVLQRRHLDPRRVLCRGQRHGHPSHNCSSTPRRRARPTKWASREACPTARSSTLPSRMLARRQRRMSAVAKRSAHGRPNPARESCRRRRAKS